MGSNGSAAVRRSVSDPVEELAHGQAVRVTHDEPAACATGCGACQHDRIGQILAVGQLDRGCAAVEMDELVVPQSTHELRHEMAITRAEDQGGVDRRDLETAPMVRPREILPG